MTLLDAPTFNEARYRRNRSIFYVSIGVLVALFIGSWFVAGRPVDWPWNWWTHFEGRRTINRFLNAVEQNDLKKAFGIWTHDPDWQQHPDKNRTYPFARFEQDWSPTSRANEYGVITSHKIVAARIYGNVLLVAVLFNGRKSGALDLTYDPREHNLNFAPPGEELYLGP